MGPRPQGEDRLRIRVGIAGGVHDQHGSRSHLNEGCQLQPIEGFGHILVIRVGRRWVHPAEPETEPIFIVTEGLLACPIFLRAVARARSCAARLRPSIRSMTSS